jgi:Cft2 family RNA processing exonuclease
MARLTPISGLAEKGPACFLVETGAARILLDLGEGPQPGLLPDISAIGRVDAVLLSHQHADHAGALRFLPEIGSPPVYATAIVRRSLPEAVAVSILPLRGTTDVRGISVTTGRSGHAPGGVWLHLAVGEGLLYTGDYCVESPLYAYDPPPSAATVLIDASYGDYESPIADCYRGLDALLAEPGPVVMPLPARGRGPEIALEILRRGVVPTLDAAVLESTKSLLESDVDCVRPEALDDLRRLAAVARAPGSMFDGVTITAPATAAGEVAARAIAALESGASLRFVFTGYVPPGTPAGALTAAKRAQFLRWNIHPRLSDNQALARSIGARIVLPAFGDRRAAPAWEKAFAPAQLVVDGTVEV